MRTRGRTAMRTSGGTGRGERGTRIGAVGGIAVLGVLALGLTACSRSEPLAAAEAVEHYDAAGDAVAVALADGGAPLVRRAEGRSVEQKDGRCLYTPGFWDRTEPIEAISEQDWDDVLARVEPVARKSGFGDFSDPRRTGSMTSVESVDEHGAVLRIDSSGNLEILRAEVDLEPCTPEALGIA